MTTSSEITASKVRDDVDACLFSQEGRIECLVGIG